MTDNQETDFTKYLKRTKEIHSNLLNTEQAAQYLGVTPDTLAVWRCTKRYGIPFVKIGRLVKYKLSDLDNFIQRRTENAGYKEM